MQNQLELFAQTLPKKPYCTDHLEYGLIIRSLEGALQRRYIQPNHPNSKLWLVYDIDRPTAVDELTDDLHLPAPHIFVQNPENGHAHAYYGLEVPVHLNEHSSRSAIRFAGALDVSMTQKMDADAGYCGLIAKNPLHEHWRTWHCSNERYQLHEIAEYLDLEPLSDRRRAIPAVGLGRNCNLFENLRKWAYRAIRQGWPAWEPWLNACHQRALGYNVQFKAPLAGNEVSHVARSVAKWTHSHLSQQGFSALQASRGSRKGAKQRDTLKPRALEMHSQGFTQRDIADDLGVSQKTISNWLKS